MTLYSPGGLNLADTTAPLILAFDDTGTTNVVFAVSASGDLTITPDGGDVTVMGTFATTGNVGIGAGASTAALFVSEATSDQQALFVKNVHATLPKGVFLEFSAAAPNDRTQYFVRMDDSGGLRSALWSDGSFQGSYVQVTGDIDQAGSMSFESNILILQGGTAGFQLNNEADNAALIAVTDAGVVTLPDLAGSGSRTVVASATGVLSAP